MTALILTTVIPLSAKAEKSIRVGISRDVPPFCFVDERSRGSKLRGMSIDMMELAGKLLRTRIVYIDSQSLNHRWEMLYNDDIDAVVFTGISEKYSTDVEYIPVGISLKRRIYVHKSCKTVVCSKDLKDKRVGVLAGESYSQYPEIGKTVPVISIPDGLKRLNQGDLDAVIAPSELIADYIIQKNKLTNVIRVGTVLDIVPLYIGVKAGNSDLFSDLSNALAILDKRGTLKSIKEKWQGVAYPENIWSRYGRFILLGVGLAGLALCAVLFWNHQLKRQIGKVTLNLRISENRSQALIESSPDMIFVINSRGEIVNANKEARIQILGDDFQLPDTKERVKLFEFAVERDKSNFQAFIDKVFVKGQGSEEFSFYDRTKCIRELSMAASPIAGDYPESDPTACLFARDVTDRNRIERELVQADRMAIIGQMAAGVAHEINNPLGIVRANLELIASRGWFAEEATEFVDAIRRNTERAGKITKNLLAVSKPGNTVMAAVNLRELLDLTLTMLKPQLKKVSIQRQDFGEAPLVFGDRNLLQQVLVNLFLNALNAMSGQEKAILTVTCCSNPQEATALIRILDNGTGIDKQLLRKIFEPFFSHGKKEGFGLGLFISQRIIERHNGIIFAESALGEGTQMVIELPLMSLAEPAKTEL